MAKWVRVLALKPIRYGGLQKAQSIGTHKFPKCARRDTEKCRVYPKFCS
jgi:hypothetical protein